MYDFSKADVIVKKILSKEWEPINEVGSSSNLMYDPNVTTSFVESKVSEENLLSFEVSGHYDVKVAQDLEKNENRWKYNKGNDEVLDFMSYLEETDGVLYRNSGLFFCPPKGFCGWHTNSDAPGPRMYLVWAEEDNKSFFRWEDPHTGEIKTKWEKKGWNINKFVAPVWHTLASWTNRVSIGIAPFVDKSNFGLSGTHSCRKDGDYGDWSISDNVYDEAIDLRTLRSLLTAERLQKVSHNEICWKGMGTSFDEIKDTPRYKHADIKYPGILIKDGKNHKGLKYRMIDGKHRMIKMKSQDIDESVFYVLTNDEVKDHIRPLPHVFHFKNSSLNL